MIGDDVVRSVLHCLIRYTLYNDTVWQIPVES